MNRYLKYLLKRFIKMKEHASRKPLFLRNGEVRRGLKLVLKFSLRQGLSPGDKKMKKSISGRGIQHWKKILHQGQVEEWFGPDWQY